MTALTAAAVDCIDDAVVVYGPDHRVTLWNKGAERIFGLPASKAVGEDVGPLVGHADPPSDAGLAPTAWKDELLIVRPDGAELPVGRSFTRFAPTNGCTEQTVLVASSLAERRKLDAVIQRFSAILDSSTESILSKTRSGIITTWNRAAEEMYGYTADEVVGQHVSILVPDDRREELQGILDQVAEGVATERLETVRRRKDGSEAMVLLSVSPLVDEAGLVVGAITVASDLTERRIAEAELELAELRFEGAFGTSAFGMAMADLVGRLTMVNPALCRLLGHQSHDVIGHGLTDFAFADSGGWDVPGVREGIDSYSDERRYLRADGAVVWLQVNVNLIRDLSAEPLYQMLQILDITSRKQLERELEHRALHDDLTGLANRALLSDRLEHALASAERSGRQVGVAFLDVDGFKNVNDALGHAAGDRLLVELSRRLVRAVRPEDTVARFGGDEFVVLCTDVTVANMEVLADRVSTAMAQRFAVGTDEVSMHVSVGITVSDGSSTGQSLLSEADAAMFRAKDLGRDRVAVFDDTMRVRAAAFLEGEQALRMAIANRDLVAHYQPIVDLSDGRPLGVEALARWHHPTGTLISPAQFIPLAESSGLILRLGELMLFESTAAIAAWNSLQSARRGTVGERQPVRPAAGRDGTRRHGTAGARGVRPVTGQAASRGDRDGADGGFGGLDRAAARDPRPGRPRGHRRLRHRLQLALVPQTVPRRHAQDRPVLHRPRGRRPRRPLDRRGGHRTEPGHGTDLPGGGRGDRGSARRPAGARVPARPGIPVVPGAPGFGRPPVDGQPLPAHLIRDRRAARRTRPEVTVDPVPGAPDVDRPRVAVPIRAPHRDPTLVPLPPW